MTCDLPSSLPFVIFRHHSVGFLPNLPSCSSHFCADVPLSELVADPASYIDNVTASQTFVVCRLGNDSQIGADALRSVAAGGSIKDLIGGLRSWNRDVDKNFPVY